MSTPGTGSGDRRRVVVVDDEATIAGAIADRLRAEGYEVSIAGDGPSAVALGEQVRPDLVVLDLMPPGFDGLEVCRRVQRDRHVPVLMLTARTDETDLLVGLGVGADDYMTKSFSPREGFTRLRLSVDGAIYWLAAVLLLLGVAGLARSSVWIPRAVALSAALGLLVFAVADPDARIAERNVDRLEAEGTFDRSYALGLSADAIPALQELPEPHRSCLLADMRAPAEDSWIEANASRSRARTSLMERPPGPCSIDDLFRTSR